MVQNTFGEMVQQEEIYVMLSGFTHMLTHLHYLWI